MPEASPRLLAIGTANPPEKVRQEDLLTRFKVEDPKIRSLFTSSHILTRHLYLPVAGEDGAPHETQGQLLAKHKWGAMQIGPQAVEACLSQAGLTVKDIDHLTCITTTGFLAPGLTALLMAKMGFREDCSRADIVGMGCNAGLNGLNLATAWARANPGKNALMVCIEVCSAVYVFDNTMGTAIVNSLFGDGAAAVLIRASALDDQGPPVPHVLGFNSHLIPQAAGAMRFDWDDNAGKFSFFLDRDIPYVVGANAPRPVARLLAQHGLKQRHIAHWIVHSGGRKVVDAIKYNVGLTDYDVRHTHSVLRDFGNLSSGSFLFSYQRLMAEGKVRRGDFGIMMTMGPGSTIETALIRWS